ncbi:MAG: hypothetical protein RIE73_07510, partial [Coleofasciculus sp. C1-SOL-03]|uniref:hypothetical protein n=1 Tax=Coleofasciculus sp. C1-SOL-03 TaxID=3069522 RepID=UPI0032F6D1C5
PFPPSRLRCLVLTTTRQKVLESIRTREASGCLYQTGTQCGIQRFKSPLVRQSPRSTLVAWGC